MNSPADLAITGVLHHQIFDVKNATAKADNQAEFSVAVSSNSFWSRIQFRDGSTFARPNIEGYEILCTTGTCYQLTLVRSNREQPAVNRGNLVVYWRPFPGPEVSKAQWLWLAYASMPTLLASGPTPVLSPTRETSLSTRLLPLFEMGRPYQSGKETPVETVFQSWDGAAVCGRRIVQLSKFELPTGAKAPLQGAMPRFRTNLFFDVKASTNISGLLVPTSWRVERWSFDVKAAFQARYIPRLMEVGTVSNALVSNKVFDVALTLDRSIYAITDYRVQPSGKGSLPADYLSRYWSLEQGRSRQAGLGCH